MSLFGTVNCPLLVLFAEVPTILALLQFLSCSFLLSSVLSIRLPIGRRILPSPLFKWSETVKILVLRYNIYVPDLVFFGESYTTRPERSESFQAQCVKRVMEANSVWKMSLVGISYGGFVAYSMPAQFKECVERVVICCAGVCLEEKDIKNGLFPVNDVDVAATILSETAETMMELLWYAFVKPPKALPSCLLNDFIDEMKINGISGE
ncbi:OLC1v1036819C1 [Oldenlandia corymbosa var. corymbosa]|uniref:OLC1v1036819C1 n=1 Tax=Oldenlandia corymbosa var. corymbosa TaxID=529605 RepID=A0AAV1CXD5_OLDCO|nr:OLC1v1036819C1 [Oldenlandia corymbosa var. corymbosa]